MQSVALPPGRSEGRPAPTLGGLCVLRKCRRCSTQQARIVVTNDDRAVSNGTYTTAGDRYFVKDGAGDPCMIEWSSRGSGKWRLIQKGGRGR